MATSTKKVQQNGTPAPASPVSGNRIITLDEFIIRSEKDFDFATGELTGLLRVLSFLGLGLSLLGLSWFYTRYVFAPPQSAAPAGAR